MDPLEKNFIQIHARMIKKLVEESNDRDVANKDLLISLNNHADLIIAAIQDCEEGAFLQ